MLINKIVCLPYRSSNVAEVTKTIHKRHINARRNRIKHVTETQKRDSLDMLVISFLTLFVG